MSARVCPICDKKMKYAHFCTNCKAYIKEPVFWNGTYNLNGDGEQSAILNHCENHDHTRENATGKVRTDYNTTAAKAGVDVQRQRQRREQGRIEQQRTGQQRSKQQGQEYRQSTGDDRLKRKKNPIFIIIFIYIMIQVLLPIIAGIFSLFVNIQSHANL